MSDPNTSIDLTSIANLNLPPTSFPNSLFFDSEDEDLHFDLKSNFSGFSNLLAPSLTFDKEKTPTPTKQRESESTVCRKYENTQKKTILQKITVFGRKKDTKNLKAENLRGYLNKIYKRRNSGDERDGEREECERVRRVINKQTNKIKYFWRGVNRLYPFAFMKVRVSEQEKGVFVCREDISSRQANLFV